MTSRDQCRSPPLPAVIQQHRRQRISLHKTTADQSENTIIITFFNVATKLDSIINPQCPRTLLPVSYLQFHSITYPLVLVFSCLCTKNLELLNSSNSSMSNLGYLQTSLKDPLLSVSLFCHLRSSPYAPWFFLRLWRFINHLLTYLLIYLLIKLLQASRAAHLQYLC